MRVGKVTFSSLVVGASSRSVFLALGFVGFASGGPRPDPKSEASPGMIRGSKTSRR